MTEASPVYDHNSFLDQWVRNTFQVFAPLEDVVDWSEYPMTQVQLVEPLLLILRLNLGANLYKGLSTDILYQIELIDPTSITNKIL